MTKFTKYGVPKFKMKKFDINIEEAINATILEETANKKRLKDWIKNNTDFENTSAIYKWDESAKKWSDKLFNLAVEILSASDGVVRANESFKYGLSLDNVSIDTNQFNSLLIKLFRIKLVKLLSDNMDIDDLSKSTILDCVIKREFPLKSEEKRPIPIDIDEIQKRLSKIDQPNTITGQKGKEIK
jgi:hypothetical protein